MPVPSPINSIRVERELVRREGGLYRFMTYAWPHVEPMDFIPGWHMEEVCTHLEAVSRGELDRLIINIPPGCAKSLEVCVFWNVWDWITHPWRRWMYASFDAALSQRDALRAKDLVRSRWFQERWGHLANPRELEREGLEPLSIVEASEGKQNTATIFWTNGGGLRFSTSVGGRSTGWHCHHQVVDDPTKPQDIQGGGKKARAALTKTENWWTGTMSTRKADPKSFARVIIMQRLHERDLAGIAGKSGEYTVLRLPMRYVAKRPCITPWGGDRRTADGELLWPARYDEKSVNTTAKDLGPMQAAAQLQQDPSPEAGAVFRRDWLNKRWRVIPAGATWIQSWDCSFDDTDGSDFVVGQVWAAKDGEFFLVDQVRERMDLPTTAQAILDMRAKWPMARRILVEKKANGPGVISTLKRKVSGLIGWDPGKDSKEGRAHAVSGYFEAGNIYLPEPERCPWVGEYVEEMTQFPKAANDDQVDATTQALLRLTGKATRLGEAMDNV